MWTERWACVFIPCSILPPSPISHTVSGDVKHHERRSKENISFSFSSVIKIVSLCQTRFVQLAHRVLGTNQWKWRTKCIVTAGQYPQDEEPGSNRMNHVRSVFKLHRFSDQRECLTKAVSRSYSSKSRGLTGTRKDKRPVNIQRALNNDVAGTINKSGPHTWDVNTTGFDPRDAGASAIHQYHSFAFISNWASSPSGFSSADSKS